MMNFLKVLDRLEELERRIANMAIDLSKLQVAVTSAVAALGNEAAAVTAAVAAAQTAQVATDATNQAEIDTLTSSLVGATPAPVPSGS
jgi:hypothetical protein